MRPTTPNHAGYRLADHVRACRIDDQVILLDLRRNKYIGIGGAQLSALSEVIQDWPGHVAARNEPADDTKLERWIDPLRHQGLLSVESTLAARHAEARIEEPTRSLDLGQAEGRTAFEWRRLLRLYGNAVCASIWLRRRSLASIAESVERLREGRGRSSRQVDAGAACSAAALYMRLRPFVYTAHDRCLHDSLTMIRYLAADDVFPRWVIGVRTRPFGAHSWVQSQETVLNDLHEHVRRYRPILVV